MKTQLQLDAEWMEVAADGLGGPDLALSGGPDGADSDLAKRGGPSEGGAAAGEHLKQRSMQSFSFSLGHEGGMAGNLQTGGQCPGEPGRFSANGSKLEGYASDGDAASECESDESVLKRLNDGEQRAMGELWGRYAGLLFSQALRVLHNAAEAEDVVVEVFSEVWRRAGGYHPERARPAAWLVTLVRRRAIDRFRERRSHERAEERLALERGGGRERIDGIEEQVRFSELRRLLELALERLPERQREAVCMVYFEGLTQREISKRTRTPIGTVKTRLELGLRKMRERIRLARMRPGLDLEKGVESPEQDAPASRTGRFP